MNKSSVDMYLTAGKLREALKDLPDDTPVYIQRIEDVYFETHGWADTNIKIADPWAGDDSEYTRAFWGGIYLSKDDVFVIDAHY